VSENVHYIVTELIEGETLRKRIPSQRIATRKAIESATQLAQGLAAAHDSGIAHRDLKPENIIVTKDGRLKILDFGLAKLLPSHAQTETLEGLTAAETNAGMVLGTAGYMSPEQVRGESADHLSEHSVRDAERVAGVQEEHQRGNDDGDPERGAAGAFFPCRHNAARARTNRAPLHGKTAAAAIPIRAGHCL
jgi:serine/threonine protein kinase